MNVRKLNDQPLAVKGQRPLHRLLVQIKSVSKSSRRIEGCQALYCFWYDALISCWMLVGVLEHKGDMRKASHMPVVTSRCHYLETKGQNHLDPVHMQSPLSRCRRRLWSVSLTSFAKLRQTPTPNLPILRSLEHIKSLISLTFSHHGQRGEEWSTGKFINLFLHQIGIEGSEFESVPGGSTFLGI